MRRKPLSRKRSRKSFRKGLRVKAKNRRGLMVRGGYRI